MNFSFKYSVPYCWHLWLCAGIDSNEFEVLADQVEQWLLNNVAKNNWQYWSPAGTMPMTTLYNRRVHSCILFNKEEDCLAFVLTFGMSVSGS